MSAILAASATVSALRVFVRAGDPDGSFRQGGQSGPIRAASR